VSILGRREERGKRREERGKSIFSLPHQTSAPSEINH